MKMQTFTLAAVISFILAFPSIAQARPCSNVEVSGTTAVNVHATSISCSHAREKIRAWLEQGSFPKSRTGWYCLYGHRVNPNGYLCSGPRGIAIIDFDVWRTRACGNIDGDIGAQGIRATNISCASARLVVRTYLSPGGWARLRNSGWYRSFYGYNVRLRRSSQRVRFLLTGTD